MFLLLLSFFYYFRWAPPIFPAKEGAAFIKKSGGKGMSPVLRLYSNGMTKNTKE
jgi:hypothetical protein